jgi:glycerol-3-phosphate acyltransferase PlsX
MITIAIDAHGGYFPDELLTAVTKASMTREHDERSVYFILVGDENQLTQQLSHISHNPERLSVVHAPDLVELGDAPLQASRDKPFNPVATACKLVKDGHADAVVSAGNPGIAVLAAKSHFELIPGIQRAALAAVYPTPRRKNNARDPFSLLLDVGASVRASSDDLIGFAKMGAAYARQVSHNLTPRVALLSNSRERHVGPPNVLGAFDALDAIDGIEFIGCIEGHDIPRGAADVIVCEGLVGDVTIKLLEGVGETAFDLARTAYEDKFVYRQGLRLLSGGLRKIKRLIDYEEYGGAPLLGFENLMILAHPRSRERALNNAIKLAIRNVRQDLTGELAKATSLPED